MQQGDAAREGEGEVVQRESAQSSNVKSVGYDPAQMLLEVEFRSGAVYQYQGVPASVWMEWKKMGFKGGWFTTNIRENYAFERTE